MGGTAAQHSTAQAATGHVRSRMPQDKHSAMAEGGDEANLGSSFVLLFLLFVTRRGQNVGVLFTF